MAKMTKKLICLLPLVDGLPVTVDLSKYTNDQSQVNITFDLEPYYSVTDWSQRNSNGQITVPWSAFSFPEDRFEELTEAMTAMEREVSCMRFPYVTQESLNSTEWTNGVIFFWNDQGSCNSALGVRPGFGMEDIEVKSRPSEFPLFRTFKFELLKVLL